MFSFAFPEPSIAVNETLSPLVVSGLIFAKDIFVDVLQELFRGLIQ